MAGERKNTVFYGTFIHSKSLDELEYLHNTAVFVDKEGKIVAVERECDLTTALTIKVSELGWNPDVAIEAPREGQFFFPGLIGEFLTARLVSSWRLLILGRHTYSRVAIPQRGHLW